MIKKIKQMYNICIMFYYYLLKNVKMEMIQTMDCSPGTTRRLIGLTLAHKN